MSGNQTAIPVIQTNVDSLTQVQQNTNKVLRNINNNIVSLQEDVNSMTIVGEVKLASLTLTQFQSVAGMNWILANGQSSVGTQYETITKNQVVPTITVTGATAFIRVN